MLERCGGLGGCPLRWASIMRAVRPTESVRTRLSTHGAQQKGLTAAQARLTWWCRFERRSCWRHLRANDSLIARTGAGMGMSCRFLGRGRVVMMMAAHVKQLGARRR